MQLDRIANLLATGLSNSAVASIVGLSPARITQLLNESETLKLLVEEKKASLAEKDQEEINISAKYLQAEHALIKQVVELAPFAELRDVTAALRVVAERQEKAKARMNPIVQQQPVLNNVVQLYLPSHAISTESYAPTLASNKEVIAIGNRSLTPLSSQGVLGLFKSLDTAERVPEDSASESAEASPAQAVLAF